MTERKERAAQQVSPRIAQFHFVPGISRLRARSPRSAQAPQTRMRLKANLLHLVIPQATGNLQPIHLGHARGMFEDAVGELAVAGKQHQSRRSVIEPPNWENSAGEPAEHMAQSGSPLGIGHGGNHMDRLIQEEITQFRRPLGDATRGFDAIAFGISLGAEFGDYRTVDADLSATNQFLGMSPRVDAGASDNFFPALWPLFSMRTPRFLSF